MATTTGQPRQKGASDAWLSDESFRGRTMISAEGQIIGEVTGLFFDSSTWRVESLRVKLRKDIADRLGVDRNVFRAGALEIPVRIVQAVGDAVILSIALDALRELLPSEGEIPPKEPEGNDSDV